MTVWKDHRGDPITAAEWLARGGTTGESESSRTAASDADDQDEAPDPPVIHLTLTVGLYTVLIEELGFLRCVAGHEYNANLLRRTLLHSGGVNEVEKLP